MTSSLCSRFSLSLLSLFLLLFLYPDSQQCVSSSSLFLIESENGGENGCVERDVNHFHQSQKISSLPVIWNGKAFSSFYQGMRESEKGEQETGWISRKSLLLPCEPFELNETECGCFINGSVLAGSLSQQEVFDSQLALNISNIRLVPSSCRVPLLNFMCKSFFISCDIKLPCAECVVAEESCASLGVVLNCSEIFQGIPPEFCSTASPALPPSCPALTCIDSSHSPLECCPDPFGPSERTGECIPQCHQYVLQTEYQHVLSTYLTFALSWLSATFTTVAVIPSLYYPKQRALPNSMRVWLIVFYQLTMLFSLWGGYCGPDIVCSYDENYNVGLLAFLNSDLCTVMSSLNIFFAYSYVMWYLWLTIRILIQVYRTSEVWKRFHLPTMLCQTRASFCVVVGTATLIPLALGIAFAIHLDNFYITSDNILEAPIGYTPYSTCQSSPSTFTKSFFFIPYISLISLGIFLVFLSALRVCITNIRLVPYQWRLFALFFLFVFITLLASIYAIAVPLVSIQNEVTNVFVCVASHPQNWTGCPTHSPAFNNSLDLFVNVAVAIFPILFCTVAFLSTKWFWQWWACVLCCRRPPPLHSEKSESDSASSLSSRTTTREWDMNS